MSKLFITFDSFPHCFFYFPQSTSNFSELILRKGAVPNFQEESNSYFWKTVTKGQYKNTRSIIYTFLQNKQHEKVKLYCLWTSYRFSYVSNYLGPFSAV